MKGSYLGPSFSAEDVERFLVAGGYPHEKLDPDMWAKSIAQHIADQKVVGLFQGRMEFGPRALGHRSILGDARSPKMQSTMNLKIKYRESFRPFAPAVLRERVGDYFELAEDSPYMLLVAPVCESRRREAEGGRDDLIEWVNQLRSDIPAVTHVDYSARIQTVDPERSPYFYSILKAFEELTGCGIVINTSFNVRGEPIVCTPEDAYRCFMRSEIDVLVLENFLLHKGAQPRVTDDEDWRSTFQLD
jgi:carbamoyltransferase